MKPAEPCKACGGQVSSEAASCPHCGQPTVTRIGPKLGKFGCGTFALFGFLIFIVLPAMFGDSNGGSETAPQKAAVVSASTSAPKRHRPQGTVVRIDELLTEYKNNELRADSKWKERYIRVTGKVDEVKKDIMGDTYVIVGRGRRFEIPQIQCVFDDGHQSDAMDVDKGMTVTVDGMVDGLMMNVQLSECRLFR